MDEKDWYSDIIGLDDGWVVDSVDYVESPYEVHIRVSYRGTVRCPVCGRRCSRHDTRERRWRERNVLSVARCIIIAKVPRSKCPEHGIHFIEVPWGGAASNLTRNFELECLRTSMISNPTVAARAHGVDAHTVWAVVRHHADEMMQALDLSGLRRIHIDETQSKKRHNYITTVMDSDTRAGIFATLGNDMTTIRELRYWIIMHNGDPDAIECICCDMSRSYISGITDTFPRAMIVFDRFHVMNAATQMVEDVRRTSGLKSKKGKAIRFKLLKNRARLEPYDESVVLEVLADYEDLGKAYMIKEAMGGFYALKDERLAKAYLRQLILCARNTGVDRVGKFADTLESHFDGILNWTATGMTNGLIEGNNSVIQATKSGSRGYRDPENMVTMFYIKSASRHPSLRSYLRS